MRRCMTLAVAALLFVVTSASAQYLAGPAGSPFVSISNLPGAVPMATLNGCDDCVETVPLSFGFPWQGNILTSVVVASNGAVIMDGSPTNMCCSAVPLSTTAPSRISFAQEDLDPQGLNGCWYLDTGNSIFISFENVSFFPGPATGSVQVQVELYSNGAIEIRYGAMVAGGANNIAAGISDPSGQVSPQSVIPEFNADGLTTGYVLPQYTGVLFVPSSPAFHLNSPESSLDLAGVQGTPYTPAVTTACLNQPSTLSGNTTLGMTLFDMAISVGPSTPNVLISASGQIVNAPPPWTFLSGGTLPMFIPFFPLALPVASPVPLTACAQLLVADPGNPDGFTLSQCAQLDVVSSAPTQPGPTGDDQALQIFFGSSPVCGPAVPFCGTSYQDCFISSNGRLTFGLGDADWSATVAEAISDPSFFGYWTDLNPVAGGTVDWNVTATTLTVNWNSVPYFAEPTTANNLALSIDVAGVCTIDVSGVVPNPITNLTSSIGDAAFLGMSCGNGTATDPGITTFSPGASGVGLFPTDMLYDFIGSGAIGGTGGLCPSAANLQTGLGVLSLVPAATGYMWIGT